MYPVLFKIGPISIFTYGTMIAIGVLIGTFLLVRKGKAEKIDADKLVDLVIWVVVGGFIGARIVYIFTEWRTFLAVPMAVLFSRSGFVFLGGLISGFIIGYLRVKMLNLPAWKVADMFIVSVALAHAFGRIGCFGFGCCYGKECHGWLGMKFPPASPAGVGGYPVIPTQLIEAVCLFVLFFILSAVYKRRRYDGEVAGFYLVLYGIIRFIIEIFRGDDRGSVWMFSTSQFICVWLVVAGIIIFSTLGKMTGRKGKQRK